MCYIFIFHDSTFILLSSFGEGIRETGNLYPFLSWIRTIPLILSAYCKQYFSMHSLKFGLFEETIHTLDICAGSIKSKGETVTEDKQ